MLLTPGRCILAASDIYFDHGRLPTDGRSYKEQDLMELTLASKDHLICALDHALTAMEDRYLELTSSTDDLSLDDAAFLITFDAAHTAIEQQQRALLS